MFGQFGTTVANKELHAGQKKDCERFRKLKIRKEKQYED